MMNSVITMIATELRRKRRIQYLNEEQVMKIFYKVQCRQCGARYQVPADEIALATFKVAEEKTALTTASCFVHKCSDHVYGVADVQGLEYTHSIENIPKNKDSDNLVMENEVM